MTVQEIKIMFAIDLNTSTESDDGESNEGKDEVEDEDNVLDTAVPACVHDQDDDLTESQICS